MANMEELKDYFRKLRKVIDQADFNFLGSVIVKKNRIDDILCCILAILPKQFKTELVNKLSEKKYTSVISFGKLSNHVKTPFFFSKNYYFFDSYEATALINMIGKTIEKDLSILEKID